MTDSEIAGLLIRFGVGLVMIVFGINQMRSPTGWLAYMPPFVRFILPIDSKLFMRMHGVTNLVLGALLLSGLWLPVAACIALAWWIWILPFATYYHWTVGLRDLAIILALLALVYLS